MFSWQQLFEFRDKPGKYKLYASESSKASDMEDIFFNFILN